MATSIDWKTNIRFQIKRRNHEQTHPFTSLIQTNNRLQEITSHLQTRNVHLQVEIEKLKEEGINHLTRRDSVGGSNSTMYALEQKLYRLQEELTEMHKKRGENAQLIIDLTALLQEKDKEIQHKDTIITGATTNNIALKQAKKCLEMTIAELEATNQMLKDEHQALQIAFAALEGKYRQKQEDNSDLIKRWMDQKAQDADRMNAENADFIKIKQETIANNLAEAANEPVTVDPDKGPILDLFPNVCITASVPTRAHHKFDAHDGEVYSLQWSYSGSFFASGGADRKIKLWEIHGGLCESKGTLVGSNAGITSLDFSPDDVLVVGASNDFASRVWTVGDHRLRHTFTGHSGKVMSSKFLTEHKVVSGSHDRTLKIWDLNSKSCIKTIFAGSSCHDLVSFHDTNVISGHFDKRVRFWDTRGSTDDSTNEILLNGRLTSLCLAPDKNQLLCCTRGDNLSVIDLRMNQVSCTLVSDGFKVGWDSARAVFSPDLVYAAAGSVDGDLYVWNISKKKVERVLKEHSHAVLACSWNPKGTSIVTCEKGKTVVLWTDY